MISKPVYVFDGVGHELFKIIEDRGEYQVYQLKDVVVSASGYKFTFEDTPQTWNYKPYEDADVSTDPAVFFDEVKRWTFHKVRR